MPAYWLKSEEYLNCSVFYPSKNALFSKRRNTQCVCRERQSNWGARPPWCAARMFDVWTIGSYNKLQNSYGKELFNLIYPRFRHFRNKIKSGERAFLIFPASCGVLKSLQALQMTPLSPRDRKNQECLLARLYSYIHAHKLSFSALLILHILLHPRLKMNISGNVVTYNLLYASLISQMLSYFTRIIYFKSIFNHLSAERGITQSFKKTRDVCKTLISRPF